MHGTFLATYEFRDMLGWRSKVVAIRMDFDHSEKILGFPERIKSKESYQIVINMDGIIEHGSPVEGSVSLNLVSEAFCV